MADAVLYERDNFIARITLNRPELGNAIDDEMLAALDAALVKSEEDIDARVIVIRGAGADFSVGEDLHGGASVSEVLPPDNSKVATYEVVKLLNKSKRRWQYLFNFPRPTIAQVHGRCHGLALNIALLCDVVVASEDAVFGDRSLRLGILPSLPLWPFMVNEQVAKELIYSGRDVPAREAEKMLMITKAVPVGQLEGEVDRYVRGLLCSPADSLAWNKEALTGILEARGIGTAWHVVEEKQLEATAFLGTQVKSFLSERDALGLGEALAKRDKPFQQAGFNSVTAVPSTKRP